MSRRDTDLGSSSDSASRHGSGNSDPGVRISLDLVAAARKHLSLLRTVANSPWLNHTPSILQAIRRYDQLWMPLMAELSEATSMVLPPWDIQWIWHCHCLNPVSFRQYCMSRFSKLLEKPAIFDDENEEYAWDRCREIWNQRYPSEPFELELQLEPDSSSSITSNTSAEILLAVSKQRFLYSKFSEPFMAEIVFLIAAKHRYIGFLQLLQRFNDGYPSKMVATSDIFLMWTTHQSFPATYARDMGETERNLQKVGVWDCETEEAMKITAKLWESSFDHPYEKAGVTFDRMKMKSAIYWEVSDVDADRKLKVLEPRFVLEVCLFVKGRWAAEKEEEENKKFLRLRTVRCHRELKIDKPVSSMSSPEYWRKVWQLQCEFGTRGVILELRRVGGGCFRRSKLEKRLVFYWNDMLRAPSLTLGREMDDEVRVVASITPPVQAPYLLKCVPDRVTDDAGAMVSDVILTRNKFRPQEGRWLSRTVLDHAGKECFVIRIRVGRGFWRRGAETPVAVKWEERIIQIREGSWSYVASSIGIAPDNIVGVATPKEEDSQGQKVAWSFSTGDELTIKWERGLDFHLQNKNSDESVRLLKGRKLHYQRTETLTETQKDDEEEGFLTLVRCTAKNPNGKATALLNWKFFAVEILPEEDAVLVLLLCTAIAWTVTVVVKEEAGNLLVRRRLKEAKAGSRDWGSVTMYPSSSQLSPHVLPWYWNPKEVLATPESDYGGRAAYNYSPADGGDGLFRAGIIR